MCAICGFITKNIVGRQLIDDMNLTMIHRGPDSQCTEHFMFGNQNSAIGHCRLSILDLSEGSKQPMWSVDKRYAIVFNGEIYNFKEIKDELLNKNYKFKSTGDTEVLLYAYDCWGEKCLEKLNGMFAFAIFDFKRNEVFLARDRFGKKPLYYYYDSENFVFASELKPLFKYPFFKKSVNTTYLGYFMRMGYIPAPNSILKGVYKLPMGSFIRWKQDDVQIKQYWNVDERVTAFFDNPITDYKTAMTQLEEVLSTAVSQRLIADVPVGVFLSSGIDSSLVSAIAKNTSTNISTYTIRVDDPQYNEADIAAKIASHLNTNHHEYRMSEKDLLDFIPQIPCYFDEPFGDQSMIPFSVLSKYSKQNITVALGGDGGDEFFCGYGHYKALYQMQKYDFLGKVLQCVLPNRVIDRLPSYARRVIENANTPYKSQMILKEDLQFFNNLLLQCFSAPYFTKENMQITNLTYRRMVLDMQTTLVDDMIHKVDRAAMSASLEVRSPLLDYKVAEFSYRLPMEFKYQTGKTKRILRDIVYQYVPESILDVPKRGFCVPVENWMRTDLREVIDDVMKEDFVKSQGFYNYDSLLSMFKGFYEGDNKHQDLCFKYLMFQLWYKKYSAFFE